MRSRTVTTLVCLLTLASLMAPAAASEAPPCEGAAPLGEDEQYVQRILYLASDDRVADLGAVTGSSGELTTRRPTASSASYDLLAGSRGADLGEQRAASFAADLDAPERIVCWQVVYGDVGGQPATVSLFVDQQDGAAAPAAPFTQAMPAAASQRSTRTSPPTAVDVTATERIAVQVGGDGAVEFGSFEASSRVSYWVIQEVLPEPDVLVVDIDFTPRSLTVQAGDTVIWGWQANIPHDVLSDGCGQGKASPDCLFASPVQTGTPDAVRFTHTFDEPGVYPYYCSIHSRPGGTAHNGVIIVE